MKGSLLMLISITLISTIIAFVEGLPLFKKKMWKELITVIILLLITISLVAVKKLSLPTPLNILNDLLYPLGKMIFRS